MDCKSNFVGLSAEEVVRNRQSYGVNVLTPPEKESIIVQFLRKFSDPLIVILLVAGILSVGISLYEFYGLGHNAAVFVEPLGIFIAIILATGLAFFFEYKAEKEFAILNQVNDEEPVQVIRSGNTTVIPRRDVVVGDIIVLNTGDEVPADARLLESVRMSVDESSLTGEPVCHKTVDRAHFDSDATFPSDMVLRGTKIMEGHGVAEVTAVGDATENGKVFVAAQIDNSVKTPLNEQLGRLGRFVSVVSYIIGGGVIAGRVLMYMLENGNDWQWVEFIAYFLQSVMLAVTLVVVAVPEGLPMAVTLSLAYSMRRMLRSDNLVRRMHACETMGAVTVICTDKTGTLTANRMQVADVAVFHNDDSCSLMTAMALNSTAELDMSGRDTPKVVGNPTEGALLLWIQEKGSDYRRLRSQWSRVAEVPFSTERKYMASEISDAAGRRYLLVKGAPEIVYAMCSGDTVAGDALHELLHGFQSRAMRTLGFAYKRLAEDEVAIADGELVASGLIFSGVAAISDPVRDDVPPAIAECLQAGIKVKIVTGDTPATAKEIGRRIGLWTDADGDANIVTGSEIADMSDDELYASVSDWKIIARARPMDKKRLVEALQRCGEVVAVTGDGTNDAPALKAAHVGLSMGDGTSVAKEASDITIVSNSFAGIGNAVMWGRSLYRNIQRFILFQLTVNVAACLTVLVGSFMGTQPPLTVTQMLWVNLVMDSFAAMALASLPPDRSVMKDAPRDRRRFIIDGAMGRRIVGIGTVFFAIMIFMLYVMEHAQITSLRQLIHPLFRSYKGLSGYEMCVFFTVFVMLQMWNLFNAKAFATHRSSLHFRSCGEFLIILVAIFVGQILIVTLGGDFFNVTPLSLQEWLVIILLTSPVLWAGEVIRLLRRRSAAY